MKEQLTVACFSILAAILAGCSGTEPNAAVETPNSNELKVAAEPTAAPTRTPLPPNVRKDADGNLIKPDGWPIQEIIPKETRRRPETGKTRKGRTVIFNVLLITPEGRPVAEAASPYSEKGAYADYYEWQISYVRELSGRDGKVFCYEYWASLFGKNGNANTAVTTATSYRLCDYDGDGKYEFKGWIYPITIPDWVKSLPGDPAAINNNANSTPDCGILCAK
ncbi:MAG: hypothetical protein AB7Q37_08460 [Pyrinomonadaceae bacterium]